MNQSFLNPFATAAIPESVHQVIGPSTEVSSLCAKFNPKGRFAGQYIASARAEGAIAIYDLETKGMIRYLEGHVKPATCIAWSDTARYLASASSDWNVVIWDLKQLPAARKRTLRFDAPVAQVSFAPKSSTLLLVTLESQQVILVDLRRRRRKRTTGAIQDDAPREINGDGHAVNGDHNNPSTSTSVNDQTSSSTHLQPWQTIEVRTELGKPPQRTSQEDHAMDVDESLPPLTTAQFHPSGAYIVAGTSRGDILAFSTLDCRLISRMNAAGSSTIREMAFDRSGRGLVVNSNDRSIRVLAVEEVLDPSDTTATTASLRLRVLHRFLDQVNRTPWSGLGFSGDGEYVYAGAAHKAAHNIYIWDRGAGTLDKILEGPREPLQNVDWHPIRPLLLSVSISGPINIWFTPNSENWSAYAPGFEELEENIEYQEGEEEFDLEDEDEVSRRKQNQEDVGVDLLSFGPAPGGSGPRVVQEVCNPSSVTGLDADLKMEDTDKWEYQWATDPETNGQDIAIYIQLEENDLDEDEGAAGM
ncbi:unnamed protein product [Sympodiomycopsis kandeliae]